MKLYSVNPYISCKVFNKNTKFEPYYYTNNVLSKDTVSFSGKKVKEITDLRLIPHITCACCGQETIPNNEIDEFLTKRIFYPAEESIRVLKQAGMLNRKKASVSQIEALTLLEAYAKFYSNESITSILSKDHVKNVLKFYDTETIEEIKKIEKMSRCLYHNSAYMIKELEKYEPRMRKTEKEVFNILKREAEKSPQKTFTEILSSPRIKDLNLNKCKKNDTLGKPSIIRMRFQC